MREMEEVEKSKERYWGKTAKSEDRSGFWME